MILLCCCHWPGFFCRNYSHIILHRAMSRIIIAVALPLFIAVASCNGQDKTRPQEISIIRIGQPKIIKTQGTGPGANVRCGLQDKDGNLWFGTTGEGVYRYDGKSFINFTVNDGLSSNFVWSMFEDNTGNIWFGTADGACRYDGKKFTAIPIALIKGSNPSPHDLPGNKAASDSYGNPSEENAVWGIMQDKTGTFWFGVTDGVYRYDGTSFKHFSRNDGIVNNSGIQIKKVEYILEDKTGDIWFGGRLTKGVFRFDGTSLTNVQLDGENWLWPMLEDNAGEVWFSNWGGAYRYDGKSFTSFTKQYGFCNRNITCIIEDKNGNIWYGSDDGGLCRYDGKSFARFTTNDGLTNNSVVTLLEDRAGNIWVGTRNTGLCRYDGETFTSFSE